MLRLVKRTHFRRLRDADGHGLARVNEGGVETLQFAFQKFGINAAQRAVDRVETCAAGEIFRCAAFILDHMRLAVDQRNAAGPVDAGQRQRIGSRTGSDKENGHFTLEQFVEVLFHTFVDLACAIGCRKTGCMQRKALGDFWMGACPIV